MAKGAPSLGKSSRERPHRAVGDLESLRRKMWQAVIEAEALLLRPRASTATKVRAIHALVQAGAAYHRLLQISEIEERIRRLEAAVLARRNGHARAG